ncbi:MAG: hypothetical protein HOV80_34565, partial [Polyangiaceae bacterium]|nr:hypothetical protein [Polyangiaceae bacterium]
GGGAPWTSGSAKYAPVWEAQITCTGTVGSRFGDVFVHGGDVFLAGTLDGNCSVFGGEETAAESAAVIAARLAGADGATVWTRADVVDGLFGFDAAGFGSDGLVIHGGFDQPFQPAGGSLLEPVTFTDHSPAYTTFLMTVDPDGALASSRALSVEQVGAHFDVEPAGAIAVVAGSYVTDFGSGPYTAELSKNPIAQLDAAGNEVWSDIVGADFPALFFAHEVAINPDRTTLLTASLLGGMTFAGDELETSDKSSPVTLLFDAAGEPVRALALQASDEGCVLHPLALSDGSFVVSGTCWGTLAIGAEVVGTPGTPLAIAIRLSGTGDVSWVRALEAPIDRFHVTESPAGLILAGSFHDTIDLGDGPHTSAGRADIFLAALDPSGATLWSQRMGDEWDNTIEGLAELDGDLIVTSISSLDPDAAPAGDGFTLLNVARLSE